jgi:hypothetical protein
MAFPLSLGGPVGGTTKIFFAVFSHKHAVRFSFKEFLYGHQIQIAIKAYWSGK